MTRPVQSAIHSLIFANMAYPADQGVRKDKGICKSFADGGPLNFLRELQALCSDEFGSSPF